MGGGGGGGGVGASGVALFSGVVVDDDVDDDDDDDDEHDGFGGGFGTLGTRDLTDSEVSAISSELHRECLGLSGSLSSFFKSETSNF